MPQFFHKPIPYFEDFYIVHFGIFHLTEILRLLHGIIQRSFCFGLYRLMLYRYSDMFLLYVGYNAILFQFYADCIQLHEACECHYITGFFSEIITIDQIHYNSHCTVFFIITSSSDKSSLSVLTGIFIVKGIELFRIFLTVSSRF